MAVPLLFIFFFSVTTHVIFLKYGSFLGKLGVPMCLAYHCVERGDTMSTREGILPGCAVLDSWYVFSRGVVGSGEDLACCGGEIEKGSWVGMVLGSGFI